MEAWVRCLILFHEETRSWGEVGGENEQFQFLWEISRQKKLILCEHV